MQLLLEALVVGLILSIVMAIVAKLLYGKDFYSLNEFLTIGFISGVLTHFAFEKAGANKWYCDNGYACAN